MSKDYYILQTTGKKKATLAEAAKAFLTDLTKKIKEQASQQPMPNDWNTHFQYFQTVLTQPHRQDPDYATPSFGYLHLCTPTHRVCLVVHEIRRGQYFAAVLDDKTSIPMHYVLLSGNVLDKLEKRYPGHKSADASDHDVNTRELMAMISDLRHLRLITEEDYI
jgi:hypothetical protein